VSIEPGEVFGYLGPNGAGKTTTIRLLMGLRPTSGSARVLGHDVWTDSLAVRRQVGYVPGDTALYDRLTGRQHDTYFAGAHGNDGARRRTLRAPGRRPCRSPRRRVQA
jgi:beta-exotoxin I transport system ATP-binding protein